jgi:hypothetical protein
VECRWGAARRLDHDGDLFGAEHPTAQGGAERGQHGWDLATADRVLRQDGLGGADPAAGIAGADGQRVPQQRGGGGLAVGLGEVGQVDLAGDGDLHGVGEPGQVFHGAGRVQQISGGKFPVFGVQQLVQTGGDLLGDVSNVVDGGHCGGHGSVWDECTKRAR